MIGMASCCGSSVKSGISAGAGRNGGHSGTKSGPAGRVLTGVMSCPVWPDGVADMQRTGIGRRLKAPGLYSRGCRFAVRGDTRQAAALAFGLHVGATMIRRVVSSIGFPTDRHVVPQRCVSVAGRALRGFRVNRLRYGVVSAASPRVAAQQPPNAEVGAFQQAVPAERLGEVLRAGGREAAAGRRERRDAMAVNPDQQHRRCDQYLPQNAGVSAASFVHRADS